MGPYLTFAFFCGLSAGFIGRSKGSSFAIWFVIGSVLLLLGIAGALLYRVERDELRRECPGCGKIVPIHDALCTRCGTELDFPDVLIAPESGGEPGPQP